MSVLFKSPSNGGGSIGGSSKGFPPGDVINIQHTINDSKILIKWQDPEDTIIDGITIAKWKGTLLIRNSDHYPTSIKDGDIVIDNIEKNKYKDVWYEDTNLTNDHVYYYRFFTYSEDKVYNDSGNMIFKNKPLSFAPILKDNTWEQIAAASESGNIPSTWNIGDEIDLVLEGDFNETVTLQIWDFNHYDKSDGTGKAGICFGMKHLMKNKQRIYKSDGNQNKLGWNGSDMRNTVMTNIFNSIPVELRNNIKEVKTEANSGGFSNAFRECTDKVFLPGYTEVGFGFYDVDLGQNVPEGSQYDFPIFTNDISRTKRMDNGSRSNDCWCTRSPKARSWGWMFIMSDGTSSFGNNYMLDVTKSAGVCFCFNI